MRGKQTSTSLMGHEDEEYMDEMAIRNGKKKGLLVVAFCPELYGQS